jgi:hypothetical protein
VLLFAKAQVPLFSIVQMLDAWPVLMKVSIFTSYNKYSPRIQTLALTKIQ